MTKAMNNYGWIRLEDRTKNQEKAHDEARLCMSKFYIIGSTDESDEKVDLTEIWKNEQVVKAIGLAFTGTHQLTGSCVGAGGGNVLATLCFIERIVLKEREQIVVPFWLIPYGRSRFYMGDRGPGEGSLGSTFAKACLEDGYLPAHLPQFPKYTTNDGFIWGANVEMSWSDGDAKQTMDVLPESRKHIVKSVADLNNADEVEQAIRNGYPVATASSLIPSPRIEADGEAYGKVSSSGGHQTSLQAVWKHPTKGRLFKYVNQWGCFDDTTEILTKDGWVNFKDIKEDEEVATLNGADELEYQKITHKHIYEYDGDLRGFNCQGVDLLVTPNHKMYIGYSNKDTTNWKLVEAQNISNNLFKMKKDVIWNGKEVDTYNFGKYSIPMDIWLEFLGYFLSEGSTTSSKIKRKARNRKRNINGKDYSSLEKEGIQTSYIVSISQINGTKADEIQKCLDKLPFSFNRNSDCWFLSSKILYNELKVFGKSYEKYIPKYVKDLSSRQLSILYKALMLGDGTTACGNNTYYTSSAKLADDVQELVLKIGFCSDIGFVNRIGREQSGGVTRHIEYRVNIKKDRLQPAKHCGWEQELVPYKGLVYCVTVPNHIIYVRRNGKAVWCGNCGWGKDGSCWIPDKDVDAMIRNGRETYAFSQFQGFPAQRLDKELFKLI